SLLSSLDEPAGAARAIYSETFYPRLHFGWSELTSIVRDRFHLIDGPAPELYDLAADPGERANRLDADRRTFAELREARKPFRRALAPPSAVDAETARAMAALGYLGSGPAAGAASGALPDPKSQLGSLAELKRGFQQMHDRKWPDAERTFAALVAANPQ